MYTLPFKCAWLVLANLRRLSQATPIWVTKLGVTRYGPSRTNRVHRGRGVVFRAEGIYTQHRSPKERSIQALSYGAPHLVTISPETLL